MASESEEVLDLEASDLVNLLADDELNTKNEGLVLELIAKWVAKDEDDRIGYITDLINTVRCADVQICSVQVCKGRDVVRPNGLFGQECGTSSS